MIKLQNKNDRKYYEGSEIPREAAAYFEKIDTEILSVKNDMLFSYLFNENKIRNVEWAVSKILDCDIEEVKDRVIVGNNKLPKQYIYEKQKYVDLLVETDKENGLLIELNNNFNGSYKRNLLYAFEIILSKYTVGSSSKYEDINRIILINLNWHNTDISKKDNEIEETTIYYNEKKDDYLIKIINVNLDKFEEFDYNKIENSNRFYKLLTINKKSDLKEIENKEKELKGYIEELAKLSQDITFRKEYMDEEMSDYIDKLEAINEKKKSFNEGIEQGIAQGIMQTKKEMVVNLHNNGASLDLIVKSTGLSKEEVEKIISTNKTK